MKLNKDLKEFIELLNSEKVEYLIVGGHCLAFHGAPRFTGDIDLFISVSSANAEKLERVLHKFGFESTGLKAQDFQVPNQVIQLGVSPNRIDLLTSIDAVAFDEGWATRVSANLDGLPVFLLDKELLIRNKLAAGRLQDRADVEKLRKSGN